MPFRMMCDIRGPADYQTTNITRLNLNLFLSRYYDNKQQIQATIRVQEHTDRDLATGS